MHLHKGRKRMDQKMREFEGECRKELIEETNQKLKKMREEYTRIQKNEVKMVMRINVFNAALRELEGAFKAERER